MKNYISFIYSLWLLLKVRARTLLDGFNGHSILYDVNNSHHAKRCLFLYITLPFYEKELSSAHQNHWQAKEMARIIDQFGYVVDVAEYNNPDIKLRNKYDLVVGLIPRGIDIYTDHMNVGCKQVAYLTSMNLAVTSANGEKRVEELYNRRGIKLETRRFAGYIEKRIEDFDAAWYIGNHYNYQSYDTFKMPPVFYIKNSGYSFEWVRKDCVRNPKSFLFFGSSGAVHKGLDLLLEIFAEEITDCKLYVCGCYMAEKDFCKEYHKELNETPNIISMGFVDIESDTYRMITEECAYTLLPSCAEGCAGSVLTNMSAGLIPIVSKECGFEEDEVIWLPDCRKETLSSYIKSYSQKDNKWIRENSEKAINIVETRYSETNFSESVRKAMEGVLAL